MLCPAPSHSGQVVANANQTSRICRSGLSPVRCLFVRNNADTRSHACYCEMRSRRSRATSLLGRSKLLFFFYLVQRQPEFGEGDCRGFRWPAALEKEVGVVGTTNGSGRLSGWRDEAAGAAGRSGRQLVGRTRMEVQ
jgi:hypothetical protein